jgi:hypothetical protein
MLVRENRHAIFCIHRNQLIAETSSLQNDERVYAKTRTYVYLSNSDYIRGSVGQTEHPIVVSHSDNVCRKCNYGDNETICNFFPLKHK